MGKFSSGKHAWAIDDRTGFKVPYKETRREWNGFRVHKTEWEPKHPQLTPRPIRGDPQAVRDARPDQDGDGATINYNGNAYQGVTGSGWIGAVTIVIT